MSAAMVSHVVSPAYQAKYSELSSHKAYLVEAVTDNTGATVNAIAKASGEDGVQALFDVLMDHGHRAALVQALNSPSLEGWVRTKLEMFLYGERRSTAALFYVH